MASLLLWCGCDKATNITMDATDPTFLWSDLIDKYYCDDLLTQIADTQYDFTVHTVCCVAEGD
jgi:hypothetical protein